MARLVPARNGGRAGAGDAIARLRAFARGQTLGRHAGKKLRDEGGR